MACVAVIPARRAERTIAATLESLRIGNCDLVSRVVVVTSNDDPTAQVVRRWSEHDAAVELVCSASAQSAGRARNLGVAAALRDESVDLLLFVDADCRLAAGAAALLERELRAGQLAAVTARILGSRGLVARVRHLLEFKEAASLRPAPPAWLPPSTVMLCRGKAFERSGGFPGFWPGEDLVFTQTLRTQGGRVQRSDAAVAFHEHPAGFAGMLRHQWRLGRSSAVARKLCPMAGSSWTRRVWLVPLLLPARMLRILHWQAGEGTAAFAGTIALLPLLAAGLAVWTAGFAAGCVLPQPEIAGYAGRPSLSTGG